MSLIKANAVQVGQSPTATQNFTLAVPSSPDGTIKLARGNSGATTQDVMNVSNAGVVSFPQGLGNISSGTAIATGSTTARSLANRFADFVSPLDFGADPTGVVDSTTFIQNALNTGKRVFLPKGTYKISSVLTVPSGGGLVGDQSATLFATNAGFNNTSLTTKYTSNSMVVNCSGLTSAPFTPTENILIHGIKIQYEFLDGTSVDGIVARNCNNIEISNVEIFGFSNTKAINLASIKDSFITNKCCLLNIIALTLD